LFQKGTLNVLRAAQAENVKRVVISSLSLSTFGFPWEDKTNSDQDWIDVSEIKSPYEKSKLMAERAAWDFWKQQRQESNGKCFELVSVLPVWVLGPILSPTSSSSVVNFSRVFYETVEKVENTGCAICDVRDVALAHIRAAQLGEVVVGKRFLISSTSQLLSTLQWTDILRKAGYKVATVQNKPVSYEKCMIDNEKMKTILKIDPIDVRTTLIDMTESLIKSEIIKVDWS